MARATLKEKKNLICNSKSICTHFLHTRPPVPPVLDKYPNNRDCRDCFTLVEALPPLIKMWKSLLQNLYRIWVPTLSWKVTKMRPPFLIFFLIYFDFWGTSQGCIFRLTCSHPELTKDHVLTSACIKFFIIVTRNVVNKSVWRKKDCSWLPLNKHAMNWISH